MKHLITLGVIFTVLSGTYLAGSSALIAENTALSNFNYPTMGKDPGAGNKQHEKASLVRFSNSFREKSTNRGSRKRPRDSILVTSKLNHRKMMSALVTLSIIARGH
jgi:hypothetical protein